MSGSRTVDVGYAWIVCSAACVVHFVVSGIQNSYGVLYIYILKELGDGEKATSAWVGSINLGVDFALSPLVTWACDRWGCRVTGVLGGIIGAVGLLSSSFIREIYLLYFSYGIVLGAGCGLCYITTFKALSSWFYRKIAFANSLCLAWECLGSVAMAPALQLMLSNFGLSWTFVILGGLFLLNSLMATMYRTVQTTTIINMKDDSVSNRDVNTKNSSHSSLTDGSFVTFILSSFLFHMGYTVTFVHVPIYAKEKGITETNSALLMSVLFPCRLLSAISFGKIVDYFHRSRLTFFQLGTLGVGLVQTFLITATTFPSFVALMVCHGICGGIVIPLRAVIVEDIIGKQKASKALGVYFGVLAVPYVAASPLAGWIYDLSNSYELSFLVAGGFCVSSCCTLFIVPLFESESNQTKAQKASGKNGMTNSVQGSADNVTEKLVHSSTTCIDHHFYNKTSWLEKIQASARETEV